jgi:hypothetical protein
MAVQSFEKVAIVDEEGKVLESGTLTVHPNHMELDGKRTKVMFANIRGVSVDEKSRVNVTHGAGESVSVTKLFKITVGLPKKVREANQQFYEALRAVYGETQLTGAEQQRMAVIDSEVAQAQLRSAQRSIWIGLALLLVGVIVSVVTFAAASGGGTYFVMYGLVLAGLGMLADGMVKRSKYRKAISSPPVPPA